MLKQPLNKNSAFTPLEIKRSHMSGRKLLTGPVRKVFSNRAGFTLIEFIAAVSLVSLIFIAGITSLISTMRFYGREQTRNRAADDLHLALAWIKKDAMQADLADVSVPQQLTLRVTDYITGATDNITYSVVSGALQRNGVNITELIDTANPPQYSTPALNYLLADMSTVYDSVSAQQRLGVMLHGRDRSTDMVGTAASTRWSRQP